MSIVSGRVARIGVTLTALLSSFCHVESEVKFDWHNAGIGDNNLGRLARVCSSRHCQAGVDALDLWFSLKEVRA